MLYRNYDETNDLYINDNSISFIIELLPVIGGDENTSNLLTQLITDGLPENCYVSFFNWASPNVEYFLDRWIQLRDNSNDLYKLQAKKRKEFLISGVRKSLFESEPFTIKNFRCFMSVTIPFSAEKDQYKLISIINRFRQTLLGTLKNIGMYSNKQPVFTPDRLINLLNEILNPINTNNYEQLNYDKFNSINKQITSSENSLRILSKDTLIFEKDKIAVKTLTVKSYPEMWAQ